MVSISWERGYLFDVLVKHLKLPKSFSNAKLEI